MFPWTWSKVVRRIALKAGVPRFSTHTTWHLCLTDLARMGWELHAIATFAGHRSAASTLTYINPCPGGTWPTSSARAWSRIHGWRVQMLACPGTQSAAAP
jgi:integrase/recombinase XerD